jgi:hypothetical protein
MWHSGKSGFVSAVAYDPAKDRNKKSQFPKIAKQAGTHILIRARVKEDLEDVRRVLPSMHVEEDLSADYQYRAVVPRATFKRYLALTVDDITYDSHFKEATSAAAKGSSNRHSAMMKVWDAMADLQPNPPYGHSWTNYGTGSGGGWADYVSPYGSDAGKSRASSSPTTLLPAAPDHVEDLTSDDADAYRKGRGPKHGFKVGDVVVGFKGVGEITSVEVNEETADTVTVKFGANSSGRFLSNFLCPTDLPEPDAEDTIDLDAGYGWYVKNLSEPVPTDMLPDLDDDAFEFVTRVGERFEDGASIEDLNEVYDEILWESMDGDEKRQWVQDGTVPTKHEGEAMRILDLMETQETPQNA